MKIDIKFYILQHINSIAHKSAATRLVGQLSIKDTLESQHGHKIHNDAYCALLCRSVVEACIPLHKLSHPSISSMLEKISSRPTPSESLIRKVYLEKESARDLKQLRTNLQNEYLWISIDETTDADGRYVVLVLAGSLNQKFQRRPYIIYCDQLTQVNHTTIAQV